MNATALWNKYNRGETMTADEERELARGVEQVRRALQKIDDSDLCPTARVFLGQTITEMGARAAAHMRAAHVAGMSDTTRRSVLDRNVTPHLLKA